jgi:hypothetical protein
MRVAPGRENADPLPELPAALGVSLEPEVPEHGSGEDHRRVADDQWCPRMGARVVDRVGALAGATRVRAVGCYQAGADRYAEGEGDTSPAKCTHVCQVRGHRAQR